MANPSGSNQTLVKIYEAFLNAIRVKVVDSVLPTGSATSEKQDEQTALLTDIESNTDGIEADLGTLVSQTDQIESILSQIETNTDGLVKVHAPTRIDYTTVNAGAGVSTSAYTQLVASLSGAVKELYIFDSSGRALFLATGAAAAEVDQIYIEPGGTGVVRIQIPAGTRLAIKAVDAAATKGQLLVAFLG